MDPTKVNSFDSNGGGNAGPQDFSDANIPTPPNGDIILVPDAPAQEKKKILPPKMIVMIVIIAIMVIALGVLAVVSMNKNKDNGVSEKALPTSETEFFNKFANYVLNKEDSISDLSESYDIGKTYAFTRNIRNYIILELANLDRDESEDHSNDDEFIKIDLSEKRDYLNTAKKLFDDYYENSTKDNESTNEAKNTMELIWTVVNKQKDEKTLKSIMLNNGVDGLKEAMNDVFSDVIKEGDVMPGYYSYYNQYAEYISSFTKYIEERTKKECSEEMEETEGCERIEEDIMMKYRTVSREINDELNMEVDFIVYWCFDMVKNQRQEQVK